MPFRPLRFFHAASLHLDAPLHDVAGLKDDVRELVGAATLTAFRRLVDAAIERQVDAVLLTGNTFDASVGSLTAEVALRQGLEQLDAADIPVFATPGPQDPAAAWDEIPGLPENLTLFSSAGEDAVDLTDGGKLLATIWPVAWHSSVHPPELDRLMAGKLAKPETRPYSIGLLMADPTRENSPNRPWSGTAFASLNYLAGADWAGDGAWPLTEAVIGRPAGPQGLSQRETGSRGGILIEADEEGHSRTTLVPLAPVRWERLVVELTGIRDENELLERMIGVLDQIPRQVGEQVRMIEWSFRAGPERDLHLEEERVAARVADSLTGLTDEAKGLRYVHRVLPSGPESGLPTQRQAELWKEFEASLQRLPAVEPALLRQMLSELQFPDVNVAGRMERWLDRLDAVEVSSQARRLGWRWFAGALGGEPR